MTAERMQAVADGYVKQEKFAGIHWQVEVNGEVATTGTAGHADAERTQPLADDAIYRLYSMTKPVVSVLALILVEQGRLRLFDMLAQLDRAFANMRVLGSDGSLKPAERPIMVEDLLTHRAGFTYEFIHGCPAAPYYRDAEIAANGRRPLEEMMQALAGLPLAHQPGTQFRYSVCTDVLAYVIERATGERVDALLEEFLFSPLGMKDTGYCVPPAKRDRILPMYGIGEITGLPPLDPQPQELQPMEVEDMYPSDDPNFRRGGHGLFSTLDDYAAFARMLIDGRGPDGRRILSRKMHEMLQANRIPAVQLPLRIGLNVLPGYGWGLIGRVLLDQGHAIGMASGGEFGWAGAASTYFWVDPREQMTGVVMTQYLGSMLPLADDMRNAAYQLLD